MEIYGICVTGLKINHEKAESFLYSLSDTSCDKIAQSYIESKEEDGCTFNEWVSNYECICGFGLAGLLTDIISDLEDIDISCDSTNDHGDCVGLAADVPWNMNEKTKNMTREEFEEIIRSYVSRITDEPIKFKWFNIYN